jgi:hypothetical protein
MAAVTAIMIAMHLIAALLLAGSAATPPVAPPPLATAVGVARARILAPAEVRRVGDRLEIRTGDRRAPTQLHRTERRDGGETADFY